MAYIGRPLQVANLAVQSGTGDGSDTTPIATLDYATVTNGIAVYLDGVRQLAGTDFNVTAQTTLTFTTAPANGVGVDVYFLGLELSIPTPADATVTAAKLASNAVTTVKIIDDAVTLAKMASGTDGNIISYDASGNPVAVATGSDGQVLTSAGAGAPPAFEAAAAGGKVVQVVHVQDGTYATGTTSIPFDNTIPQITEGVEFMTLAITPTNSSNILFIDVVTMFGSATANSMLVNALFVGTTANALATAQGGMGAAANRPQVTTAFKYRMAAGVTTELTFRLRAGLIGSGTLLFNGYNGGAYFGGSYASTITITEIAE